MAIDSTMRRETSPLQASKVNRLLTVLGGVLAGLSAAAIWAGGSVVSRMLMTTASASPEDLAFLRYASAFPVAVLLVALFPRRLAGNIPAKRLVVLLLLAGPLYQALLIWGYGYATAGAGALLVSGMVPVFSLALALITPLGATPVHPITIAGAMIVVAGLWLHQSGASAAMTMTPAGVVVFLAAAALWAVLNMLISAWSVDPRRLTIALVIWSPAFWLIWPALSGSMVPTPMILEMPLRDIALQVVVHGWLGALVATGLFFHTVRTIGAPTAAILQAVTPAFAAWLGDRALSEHLLPLQAAGLALAITGMVLAIIGATAANRK